MAAKKRTPEEPTLEARVGSFRKLLESGRTLQAIEEFYAEHALVFENRALVRTGREACLRYEKKALEALEAPPKFRVQRVAVNERDGVAFLEYLIRYTARGGRPMRLEEVSVQTWERGRIVEERFYYEGLVDEGD